MREETRDLSIGQALDLGVQMAMANQHQSAIGLFQGVLMHEPNNFEAIERLGSSLFELKRYHEALYWFWRGRKLNRRHPMALTNYGLTVCQLGHPEEGVVDLEKAVYHAERTKDCSNDVKALVYNNLGNTLERLKRHGDALTALEKGIAYNPNHHFPHYNRGIVLLRLNRRVEAIAALERCLKLHPNDPDATYNLSMAHLQMGDFKRGFEEYEARLITSENKVVYLGLPPEQQWQGENLDGKTILVHGEQGLGDDIQFFRYLPRLAKFYPSAKIKLVCHTATAPLVAHLHNITILPTGQPIEHSSFDHWVALMSLPLRLYTIDEENIPPPFDFPVMADAVEKWRWPVRSPEKLNVAVCWAGNWLHKNNEHRSIPLRQFAELFSARGCHFTSVQQVMPEDVDKFVELKKQHGNIHDFAFTDLRDTAAALLNVDVVVTVDTAIAHLSATLGVPTWILIPKYSTDWRWQLERADSPWYPSARLIRQTSVGDWPSTLKHVRQELEQEADRRAATRAA